MAWLLYANAEGSSQVLYSSTAIRTGMLGLLSTLSSLTRSIKRLPESSRSATPIGSGSSKRRRVLEREEGV